MPRQSAKLKRTLTALAEADTDLARAIQLVGPLPDRSREPGFAALLKILFEQQLSVASAAAIWGRFATALGEINPDNLLRYSDTDLRAFGLSRPKILYSRHLAQAMLDGVLDLDGLHRFDDMEAVAHLTQVKGIGRWTAEIYLLFALGREDIWPADDLALQEGLRLLKKFRKRPDRARMDRLSKPWRPYRGTAARILWRYYGLARKGALPPDGA